MRIPILFLGFAAGAYVTWKVALPEPLPPISCLPAANCPPAEALAAGAPPAGLEIVLYDPLTEPLPRDDAPVPHFEGWSSAEVGAVKESEPRPLSLLKPASRLQIVGMGQAGAVGACVFLDGIKRHCVALIAPGQNDFIQREF